MLIHFIIMCVEFPSYPIHVATMKVREKQHFISSLILTGSCYVNETILSFVSILISKVSAPRIGVRSPFNNINATLMNQIIFLYRKPRMSFIGNKARD